MSANLSPQRVMWRFGLMIWGGGLISRIENNDWFRDATSKYLSLSTAPKHPLQWPDSLHQLLYNPNHYINSS